MLTQIVLHRQLPRTLVFGLTSSPRASHPVVPTVGRFLFRQIQYITIFFKRQYFFSRRRAWPYILFLKGEVLRPLWINNGNNAVFLLSSSSSYAFSNIILSHMGKLKSPLPENNMKNFIEHICEDAKKLSLRGDDMETMVLIVDLLTLKACGLNFGAGELISTKRPSSWPILALPLKKNLFDKALFHFSLERGEKLVLFSSGLRKNWCNQALTKNVQQWNNESIQKIFMDRIQNGGKKFLHEIFLNLKKISNGSFLEYDVSCITIEVDKNVLFTV